MVFSSILLLSQNCKYLRQNYSFLKYSIDSLRDR